MLSFVIYIVLSLLFQKASSFQIDDIEMHSDEDFEKTLELLDEDTIIDKKVVQGLS